MQINQLPERLSAQISDNDWLLLQSNPGGITHKVKLSELLLNRAGGGMNAVFLDGGAPYTPKDNDRCVIALTGNYNLPLPANPNVGYFFSILPVGVDLSKRLRLGSANFLFQGLDSSVYLDLPFRETGFIYTGSTWGWIATDQANITIVKSDPLWSQVILLLPFEGSEGGISFPEAKANRAITLSGAVSTSTTQSKWGKGAAFFNGSGGYLRVAPSTDFNLPGDFTIEWWMYLLAYGTSGTMALFRDVGLLAQGGYETFITNTNAYFSTDTSTTILNRSFTYPLNVLNAWRHHAITRQGNNYRYFVEGNQLGTTVVSAANPASGSGGITIGRFASGYQVNGYLNDLRITKGTARYTANFTPPTEAFPRG